MADFLNSFQKGIEAAAIAEENEKEIESVFKALNEQLNTASKGTIHIIRGQRYIDNGFGALATLANFKARETENIIEAHNPLVPTSTPKEIAKWKMSKNGYPFYITFDNKHIACENKEALESSLKNLLSDAGVGKKLYAVMNLEIPKDEDSETN